jgi:uncharacterized membrane protein YczE
VYGKLSSIKAYCTYIYICVYIVAALCDIPVGFGTILDSVFKIGVTCDDDIQKLDQMNSLIIHIWKLFEVLFLISLHFNGL